MDGELTYQAWATNYENELPKIKPCPFCGGEAELTGFDAPEYWVWCPNCKASTDAHTGKQSAVAAWNKRAETVTVTTGITTVTDAPQITYVPERTCEYVIEDNMNESEGMGDVWFRCTNCGTCYDYYADDWLLKMSYCPHCGAKVVSE